MSLDIERSSGILLPIFSLPSKYGIGDFGSGAYKFIDFLKKSGQKFWQILPVVQTGYGNSPYSSISSASFNPYFISPEILKEKGLLTESEIGFSVSQEKYIDYGKVYSVRFPMLEMAFTRFDKTDADFIKYVKSKKSYNYALFMTLKYASGQKHFYEWEDKYMRRDKSALKTFEKAYKEKILFWQFVQYEAEKEWKSVKKYANDNGIMIIGDLPLYVALDSVDVWVNPNLYKLNQDFSPKKVAGVPPDYFSSDGQLWGNPVYDYSQHIKDNFSWWVNRLKSTLEIYDYVRIDHFRGLDRFFEIDSGAKNARVGEWVKVPSHELFSAIKEKVDIKRIIAEDLGIIDDSVRDLLSYTTLPGMKILSFAFNGDKENLYLPERIGANSVCYTGTHDNDTLVGLISGLSDWDKNNMLYGVKNSLSQFEIQYDINSDLDLANAIIILGERTKSNLFILPMQDILLLGSDYRINEPGIVKNQNWAIKFNEQDFSSEVSEKLLEITQKANR